MGGDPAQLFLNHALKGCSRLMLHPAPRKEDGPQSGSGGGDGGED